MKKYILLSVLFFQTLTTLAQGTLAGGFEHVIEVGRYSDWGKHYLTITDIHELRVYDEHGEFICGYLPTFTPIKDDKGEFPLIDNGDLILEIDGKSTMEWSKEQFYKYVDNLHDIIGLKIRCRHQGEIRDKVVRIQPKYELHKDLVPFGNDLNKLITSNAGGGILPKKFEKIT